MASARPGGLTRSGDTRPTSPEWVRSRSRLERQRDGLVAQRLEHSVHIRGVAGSNPAESTPLNGARPGPAKPDPAVRAYGTRRRASYAPFVSVRLDHVVIAVADRARSDAFYREVVGAEIVERDGRVFYRVGEQQLNVHAPGVRPAAVARIPIAPGNSDLCFEWAGPIAGAIARLERNGVAIELGPLRRQGARGSGTSVYFRDPDGSLLELISYSG